MSSNLPPWTEELNLTFIRHLEDFQGAFWKFYVGSISVLRAGGSVIALQRGLFIIEALVALVIKTYDRKVRAIRHHLFCDSSHFKSRKILLWYLLLNTLSVLWKYSHWFFCYIRAVCEGLKSISRYNSCKVSISVVQKPADWFLVHISWLVSLWWDDWFGFVLRKQNLNV